MEIRNLISFVHVAELNSFTKAARALGYTQSTVSFQIKQLEEELGCQLFERINHKITLTDEGQELLGYALNIDKLTNEFKQSITASGEPEGFIHVVTPDSVCEDMLLTNYKDFHKHYPGIALKFTTADTRDMFAMLDRNEADIVVTLDSHAYRNDYIIAKEEHVDMHFVASPKSPLARLKNLSVSDLIKYPFILTEKEMGYRKIFDNELAKRSMEILPVLEVGRTDIIAKLLEFGEDVSYLPDFVTDKKIADGSLVYLDVQDFETDIWKQLVYHRNKWISKPMQIFIEYVKCHEFR